MYVESFIKLLFFEKEYTWLLKIKFKKDKFLEAYMMCKNLRTMSLEGHLKTEKQKANSKSQGDDYSMQISSGTKLELTQFEPE